MFILKAVISNITLFGAVVVVSKELAMYGENSVIDEIDKTLNDNHFKLLTLSIKKQLNSLYPEINSEKWKMLDTNIKKKQYREFLISLFNIGRFSGYGMKNVYVAIANAWQMMNRERFKIGNTTMPYKRPLVEIKIKPAHIGFLTVNGQKSPNRLDVGLVGAFNVIDQLVKSTHDTEAIVDVLQQIIHYLFIILDRDCLISDEQNKESQAEEIIGKWLFHYQFDSAIDALKKGVISYDEDRSNALDTAIAAVFNEHNNELTIQLENK